MAVAAHPLPCRLEHALGHPGLCSGERCPFWERPPAGSGACIFEELDLYGREQLTRWLLELRRSVEQDEEAVRREFFERLNAGRSD